MTSWRGYFEEETTPLTLRERDRLYDEKQTNWSAFRSRHEQKFAVKRPPHSQSNIEINHRMRTLVQDCVVPKPNDSFRLWIDSGRKSAPFPPRSDTDYNSNLWRNFSGQVGYKVDSRGRNISELVADMYPINIPPHSRMNENTFVKFLSEVPVIKDPKRRDLAISRSVRELKEFKELKLRSEMRVPPITERGDIVPPKNFKKYKRRDLSVPECTATQSLRQMTELERDSQRSVLGTHRSSGTKLWKLTFRENHPDYKKMKADQNEKLLYPVKSPIPGEIWFQ